MHTPITRVALLTFVALAASCASTPDTSKPTASTDVTKTRIEPDPRPTTGPATVRITSPYVICGVISEVDRKAGLRSQVSASDWMADKPEVVYADVLDGELIGAPDAYAEPPCSFEVSPEARALVVCFHKDSTYGDRVTSNTIDRIAKYGEYSYEFIEVTPGGLHNVTVDENSPQEWTCYGSCPFVYLEQAGGADLALGEILKDAIGPGMERIDPMTLPNTKGLTRVEVRIQEEIEGETSYLNLIRLKTAAGHALPPTHAKLGHHNTPSKPLRAALTTQDDQHITLTNGQTLHLVFELNQPLQHDATLEVGGHYRLTPGLANRPRAHR